VSSLELQREILEAAGNPFLLADICRRHGVDPALWWYFHDSMTEVRKITEQAVEELSKLVEEIE
jgi:hypothetical protein